MDGNAVTGVSFWAKFSKSSTKSGDLRTMLNGCSNEELLSPQTKPIMDVNDVTSGSLGTKFSKPEDDELFK